MFTTIKKLYSDIVTLPIGLLVILIHAFMIISPKTFFGEVAAEHYRFITLLYLVMFLMPFALKDFRLRLFNTPIKQALPKFFIFFILTYISTAFIATFLISKDYFPLFNPFHLGFGIAFLDSFVTGVVEESWFRDFLQSYISPVASSIVFSIFHWGVYSRNVISLVMMFLLGQLWTYIKKKYSPSDSIANMGSHSGWTLAARIFQSLQGVKS